MATMEDFLNKIDSLKSALDGYRPFPEHVVKHLRDYYRVGLICDCGSDTCLLGSRLVIYKQ